MAAYVRQFVAANIIVVRAMEEERGQQEEQKQIHCERKLRTVSLCRRMCLLSCARYFWSTYFKRSLAYAQSEKSKTLE